MSRIPSYPILALAAAAVLAGAPTAPATPVVPVTDNLVVHFMGDVGATYGGQPVAEGGLVAQWDDQALALGGNNFAQVNTDARRPTWHSNVLNGHAVLRFNGNKDFLVNGGTWAAMNGNEASWFVVFKSDFTSEQSIVRMNTSTNAVLYGSLVHSTNNKQVTSHSRTSGGGWMGANSANMNADEFHVLSAAWSADGFIRHWVTDDGATRFAETGGANNAGGTFNNFRIGSHNGSGTRFRGDIAEILLYGTALSAPERRSVEDYLWTKYFAPLPPNHDVPLANNLRLHATGDSGYVTGGRVLDTAGTPQPGTIVGAVGTAAGILGEALSFTGSDSNYVDFGNFFDPGPDGFTVSLWFNPEGTSGTEMIVGKGNAHSSEPGWSIWTDGSTLHVRGQQNAAGNNDRFGQYRPNSLDAGEWHHVALVLDRETDTIRGYLNGSNDDWLTGGGGSQTDSLIAGSLIDTAAPLLLGRRESTGVPYAGLIDDFAIWDRALAPAEIQYLFNKGLTGFNAASIPEPTSLVLFAFGALALLLRRGRRK